jgi:hypothetical protein
MSWTKNYSAKWANTIIAKASKKECVEFDGNIYFPLSCLEKEYFSERYKNPSSHQKVITSNLMGGKEKHLISMSLSMEKLTKIVVSFLKIQNQKHPPSKVKKKFHSKTRLR